MSRKKKDKRTCIISINKISGTENTGYRPNGHPDKDNG